MRPLKFRHGKRRGGQARKGNHVLRTDPFGKINNPYEDFAYSYSMDGADEFESNEHWGDNSSLVRGPFTKKELRIFWGYNFGFLDRTERREILTWAGFIFHEDSQGLVTVHPHTNREKLEKAWEECQKGYAQFDEES